MNHRQEHPMHSSFTHTAGSGHHAQMADEANTPRHSLIPMKVEGVIIPCRDTDGFYSATAIATATGKDFGDYLQDPQGSDLLDCTAKEEGGCWGALIHTDHDDSETPGTTWIHPCVATQFANWASPGFAVMFSALACRMFEARIATNSMPSVPDDIKGLVDIITTGIAIGMRNKATRN